MATLAGNSIASSYTSLLKLNGNTDSTAAGNGSNAIQVKTGDDDATPLFLNTDRLGIGGHPDTLLHLSATDSAKIRIESTDTTATASQVVGGLEFEGNDSSSGGDGIRANITATYEDIAGKTKLTFGTADSNASVSDRLTIDGDGNATFNNAVTVKNYIAIYDNDGSTLAGYVGSGQDMAFGDANDLCIRGVDSIKFTANDGNADAMTIDSSGNIGIGEDSPDELLHLKSSTDAKPVIKIEQSGDNANGGGLIFLTSGTANDNDDSGVIRFKGMNDAGTPEEIEYATIYVNHDDVSDGSEDATMHFRTQSGGSLDSRLVIQGSNIGIGNATPSSFESSASDLVVGSTTGANGITIVTGTTSKGKIHFADGISGAASYNGYLLYDHNSDAGFSFGVLATTRFKIDQNSRISLSNNDSGTSNTVFGYQAGNLIGAGDNYNVFIGHQVADADMTDATQNVGMGYQALTSLTTGDSNTAIGSGSLYSLNTGNYNVAMGHLSADAITTAQYSVAIGYGSLGAEVTRGTSVAIGYEALALQTHGSDDANSENVGIGFQAGLRNVTGTKNVSVGFQALKGAAGESNSNNVAIGSNAMLGATTGNENVAIGSHSMYNATTAADNVVVGREAVGLGIFTGTDNVIVGKGAGYDLTSATNNTFVGRAAGANLTVGANNVAIGFQAFDAANAGEAANIAIGYAAMGAVDETNNAGSGVHSADNNVAIGYNALLGGIIGGGDVSDSTDRRLNHNIAIGYGALDATGTNASVGQIAMGYNSLGALTTGARNLAIGYQSLYQADVIDDSIAIGYQAMGGTDAGTCEKNIAIGNYALDGALSNALHNVAIGYNALTANTSAGSNVAIGGSGAGGAITTAGRIVAIGDGALGGAAQSQGNTGVGYATLYNTTGEKNTAFGYQAGNTVTSGTENTVVGWDADVTGSGAVNQTVIGSETTGVADNSVTLGNADVTDVYMASDKGATVHCAKVEVEGNISSGFVGQFENDGNDANRYGLNVVAGADDGSGTTYYLACKDGDGDSVGFIANTSGTFALTDVSDQRLKKNIVDTSIKGIEKINQLKVRDFDWKKSEEKTVGGFIAQEVKDVFPQAVNETNTTVDGEENIMGVSRDMLVPLLIKAVQELSAKVTELENK